jgi:EAL and modified HD-GYP domain-containing signal transduction protein
MDPAVVENPIAVVVPATAPMRFVGRQPIVDRKGDLFGYELLFRTQQSDTFLSDPEEATREIVDYCSMLIPDRPQGLAFVNCTRTALVESIVTLLPSSNTVLEILENIEPDPDLIESCLALRQQGYRFALDDFSPLPSRTPLIPLADFIKIDFRTSDARARREIYSMAGGAPIQFLAEKIETYEEMRIALSEGCSLFQGYFFARPVTVASPTLPRNHLVYLRLLAALGRRPADLREIERLVMSDASLCYRVLRLANSALYGLFNEVTSVRGALLLVGDDAVRRMVSVAVAGALAGSRSTPLLSMALVRARFCESLAPHISAQPSELYLLGMLSLLELLLETPMDRILEALPIGPEMKAALSGQPGILRSALDLARCLESCEWGRCQDLLQFVGLTEGSVTALYLESVRWASTELSS